MRDTVDIDDVREMFKQQMLFLMANMEEHGDLDAAKLVVKWSKEFVSTKEKMDSSDDSSEDEDEDEDNDEDEADSEDSVDDFQELSEDDEEDQLACLEEEPAGPGSAHSASEEEEDEESERENRTKENRPHKRRLATGTKHRVSKKFRDRSTV